MSDNRIERLKTLISLLDEADFLQQELIGESHSTDCSHFHYQLSEMSDFLDDIVNELEYINSND
jgi:hypothetical protein